MGFWYSHWKRGEHRAFFDHLCRTLAPGALVVMLNNRCAEGSGKPISHTHDEGNAYQQRKLASGSTHVVLKNFPMRAPPPSNMSPSPVSGCLTMLLG